MNFIFKTYRDEWLTLLRGKDDVEVVFSKRLWHNSFDLYNDFISPFQGLVSIITLSAGLKSCTVEDGLSGL
jgi:hypothetical protein